MNKERILALADLIEKQPHVKLNEAPGFNMSDYRHKCGTPACIAGWAAEISEENSFNGTNYLAEKYLELDRITAKMLFAPHFIAGYHKAWKSWNDITPQQAATTLRKLVETGEVDWSHAS